LALLDKIFGNANKSEVKKQTFEIENKNKLPENFAHHQKSIQSFLLQFYQLCLIREYYLEDIFLELDRINNVSLGKLTY
jgi:DNA-binding ferritin-like protein (Dps family)